MGQSELYKRKDHYNFKMLRKAAVTVAFSMFRRPGFCVGNGSGGKKWEELVNKGCIKWQNLIS